MSAVTCSDRVLSDITICSQPQTHPEGLCGTWTYEYASPYCPYSNQQMQSTYMLLSCGVAYHSTIDKYDEGSDYFNERRTSGWGQWFAKANGELIITCRTVTTSCVGGSVCGDEGQWKDSLYSSDIELRNSSEDFMTKYTRHRSLDELEEEKLRAQMHAALKSLPPKFPHCETPEVSISVPRRAPRQTRRGSRSSSQTCRKQSALSGLRCMFSRSKRACS